MHVTTSTRRGVVLLGVLVWLAAAAAAVPAPAQTKKPVPKPAPAKPAPKAPPVVVAPPPPPAPPPPEDLVVNMRYASADKSTTSTVSMKGKRQRIDYGPEMAVVQQCDTGHVVQINDANKTYLEVESSRDRDGGAAAAKPARKGGTITYTTTITDTGERKPLFGMTARHLQTVLTKTSTPDACDKRRERIETDGWYVDVPAIGCPAAERPAATAPSDDCHDTITYEDPPGSAAGYPLAYVVTNTDETGKATTLRMEVTDYAKKTLADSLFEVPKEYTAAANLVQFSAPADGLKRAGVLRVCATTVAARADPGVSLDDLTDALVVSLGDAGIDAVRLTARPPEDEARTRQCDFVLATEVTEVRKPGKGLLGKVAGTADTFGAKVDFRLVEPGAKAPQLASSQRSGGSTLKTAIGAAKTLSRYVTPLGMLSSSFSSMGTMAAVSGGLPSPAMQQGSDPVVNTVFFLVDKATGNKPEPELVNEGAAVASAMLREVDAIAAFVTKKPK